MIQLKRAYEEASGKDGYRVLVERLWPRGVTKEEVKLDAWLKEVAPSTELRQWFSHKPAKWAEFQKRYSAELKGHASALDDLRQRSLKGTVTLVYSSKDEVHNNAVVLKKILER